MGNSFADGETVVVFQVETYAESVKRDVLASETEDIVCCISHGAVGLNKTRQRDKTRTVEEGTSTSGVLRRSRMLSRTSSGNLVSLSTGSGREPVDAADLLRLRRLPFLFFMDDLKRALVDEIGIRCVGDLLVFLLY